MSKTLVKKSQVENVVEALLQLLKKTEKSVSLIDAGQKIDLQVILTAVPTIRLKFRVDLPHSIDEDVREVCLFVNDLDKKDREYEKTVYHYENLLKEKGVTKIAKIIPVKALRTDYCEHQSKRTLAKAYDMFLADARIMSFLPGMLGKIFYNRKKTIPVQVNLQKANLKEHLDQVINNPEYEFTGTGSTSSVQVGHDKMSKEELVDNTFAALKILAEKAPGGKDNLKRISLRCTNRHILPLYFNIVNPKDIMLPEKKEEILSYIDEVTTVEDGLVHVTADGYVEVIKDRKRKSSQDQKEINEKKPKVELKEEIEVVKEGNAKKGKKTKVKKEGKNKKKGVSDESVIEIKEEEDDDVEIKEEEDDETKVDVKDKTKKKKKGNKGQTDDVKVKSNSKGKKRKLNQDIPDVITSKEEISDNVKSEDDEPKPQKKKGKENSNASKQKKGAVKPLKQTKGKKQKKGK